MAESFSFLLEAELQTVAGCADTAAQAKFLGVTTGHLSRLKNGKLGAIGERAAMKIARRLRADDPAAAQDLGKRLFEASKSDHGEISQGSMQLVTRFFERLASPECNPDGYPKPVLVVSYGDLPRTDERARHTGLLFDAAKAVAEGLTFVMVNPFGQAHLNRGRFQHTREVRNYLEKHYQWMRAVYRRMRDKSIHLAGDDIEVGKRVLLFERKAMNDSGSSKDGETTLRFFSGISTRCFFAKFSRSIPPVVEENVREIWEWIAGLDEDVFIRRDPQSIPEVVMEEQFHPLTTFHRVFGRFPMPEDFDDFAENGERAALGRVLAPLDEGDVNSGFIDCPWQFAPDCEEFLRSSSQSQECR